MSEFERKQKEKWLKEKGFVFIEELGFYEFRYYSGNYGARYVINVLEVENMPFDVMKDNHKYFMEKVNRREIW